MAHNVPRAFTGITLDCWYTVKLAAALHTAHASLRTLPARLLAMMDEKRRR